MPDERMPPGRAVRLLRAKAGELENRILADFDQDDAALATATSTELRLTELTADVALIAGLLADYIEHSCR